MQIICFIGGAFSGKTLFIEGIVYLLYISWFYQCNVKNLGMSFRDLNIVIEFKVELDSVQETVV